MASALCSDLRWRSCPWAFNAEILLDIEVRSVAGKQKKAPKRWILQHLWLAFHAPPQPEGAHLWCDPGSHWTDRAYLVPGEVHSSGMELRPCYWVCAACAKLRGMLPGLIYATWRSDLRREAIRMERAVYQLIGRALQNRLVYTPDDPAARLTAVLAGGSVKSHRGSREGRGRTG